MDWRVQCCVQTPLDEFTFRLNAQVVSIAVNTKVLPMLPWESLFYKPGSIDGVSSTTQLPSDLMVDHQNVREAVTKALGGQLCTFSPMRKDIGGRLKALLSLSRTFALEWEFLNSVVQAKANDLVRQQIFDALPSEANPKSMKDSLLELDLVRKTDLVFAAGSDVQSDVDDIRSIVAGLIDGIGPTERQLNLYSPFFRSCLKHMEYFVEGAVEMKNACKLGKLRSPARRRCMASWLCRP